ncbi:Fe-S oxidoreductase [Desulfocapsa sulfexigens DSM 10523]|uniref:Fe-S oxidoreductase n=1 Tax=Desulfocapsa sulfexigens (strain DSM 10523 / SB164P1) TaxID=1167006 RepID=M1P5X5_DESSD|nr:Fe-S oxidoreductase [Desulfocapsa sulfexigens DSM 10523]
METLDTLLSPIESIAKDCVNCGICVKECAFLQEYGSPQKLAESWLERKDTIINKEFPFECSLCGLCHGVCPKELDSSAMFLAMRQELVNEGHGRLRQHKTIRAYERRGSSSLLSWYYFPENCHTVLFPGCAIPGSRPETFSHLFELLQETIPDIGIVFDCCTKPSHDLGDMAHFKKMFAELCSILSKNSVTKVLVSCPNCHRIFKEYSTGIEVRTVYEELLQSPKIRGGIQTEVTIHDPCGVRFVPEVQQSTRNILQHQGITIREMEHSRERTFCCGEGGSAGFIRPDFAREWTQKRVTEAGSDPIISYCAGCTHFLGESATTHHLLDLLFFPEAVVAGKQRVSKTPVIYWNRFRLKRALQKKLQGGVSGSRQQLSGSVSSLT